MRKPINSLFFIFFISVSYFFSLKVFSVNTVSDNTGRLIDIRSGENLDGYYKIIDWCIIGNYLQGRLEGRLETYHSSGNIKLIGDYRDSKKHSEWKEYDDQQRVVWIRYYDKGCPKGTWIRYGYSCGLPVIAYEECYENECNLSRWMYCWQTKIL